MSQTVSIRTWRFLRMVGATFCLRGEAVGLESKQVEREVSDIFSVLKKSREVTFSEPDYSPPIYNVWAFGKKTNETEHFGNTEQRIVDNLLWLYTEPGDIVVDPFGGGGSFLLAFGSLLRGLARIDSAAFFRSVTNEPGCPANERSERS